MGGAQPLGDAALPVAQRVVRAHLAAVYATYTVSALAHAAVALVIGVVFYRELHDLRAAWWTGLVLLVDTVLLCAPRWHAGLPPADSPRWVRRLTLLVLLVSLAMAAGSQLFVPAGNLTVTFLLALLIAGSGARAVQSLWPLRGALVAYTVPMTGSLIVALAMHGGTLHTFMAGLGVLYLLFTLQAGLRQQVLLTASLVVRYENEALATRLGEQIAATERASAEKTRFLATASHDLRQPLHAIALFGAALEKTLRGRPEALNAERLMRAVRTLGGSLDTMLDVSRLDAGVVSADVRPVSLDALFLPLNHLFAARAELQALQLRVRASGLWVHSDPELLQRMLSNLIDNALKYTPNGGVAVVARARGMKVWIEVCDTGIGIEPAQRDRIFEEFYQVDNPGRDRARGLGIGLSIVQRLSRLLDHPVQVRSRAGRGTCFRLALPSARPPPPGELLAPRPAVVAAALPARVLLIDDDSAIREAMCELLRTQGIAAVAVPDECGAATAWQQALAQQRPFDLLVCDYRLPDGADGLEIGLRLRQRFDPRTPLLLVTGETSPERLQQVRASGVPVVFKPVDPDRMLHAFAEAVRASAPAALPAPPVAIQ